jgi:hypothetical protein
VARSLIVFFIALSLAAATPVLGSEPTATAESKCGSNRWDVKTLSDAKDVSFTPTPTTVEKLVKVKKPDNPRIGPKTPRQSPVEFTTYRLRARLMQTGREGDSDIHLVIAPPGKTSPQMIVEFPAKECLDRLSKVKRKASMNGAWKKFDTACGALPKKFHPLQGEAEITGVGFLDIVHGRTRGQARNGIELHPVLKFDYLSPGPCRPPR